MLKIDGYKDMTHKIYRKGQIMFSCAEKEEWQEGIRKSGQSIHLLTVLRFANLI